jgi:hypothetical protein
MAPTLHESFEKLVPGTWAQWSEYMLAVLTEKDLVDIVTGDKKPPEDVKVAKKAAFTKR